MARQIDWKARRGDRARAPEGDGASAQSERPWQSDVIAGRNPVLEALKAQRPINKLLIQKGEREGSVRAIEAMARDAGVAVQFADRAKLDGLTGGGAHQGVVAMAAVKEFVTVEDIIDHAEAAGEGDALFIVIADGVEDPHNLGAIIRTAEATGAHGVVIPKRRASGLTPVVAKASSGAVEHMRVARVANVVETMKALKKRNVWIVGADSGASARYTDCDLTGRLALVIGGEGAGLSRLVKETCDFTVKMPMRGKVASLNASVAASVLMYESLRQREQGQRDREQAPEREREQPPERERD
jgi:23S rRNA (guanosine2251-2'-O)-methyltransferase